MTSSSHCISITNIDSVIPLLDEELGLIVPMLAKCDLDLSAAAKATPAYLMSDDTFGRQFDAQRNHFAPRLPSKDNRGTPAERISIDTEYLGVFVAGPVALNTDPNVIEGPAIYLCPERVMRCAGTSSLRYRAILVKVFMHEWMHAMLHASIPPDSEPSTQANGYLAFAIEEATANFGALLAMDSMNTRGAERHVLWGPMLDEALQFAKRQPHEYALGADMFMDKERKFDASAWQTMKMPPLDFDFMLEMCTSVQHQMQSLELSYSVFCTLWLRVIVRLSDYVSNLSKSELQKLVAQ